MRFFPRPAVTDPAHEQLIRDHYRWWTVMAGRDFVKLGPVSVIWYRFPEAWRVEVWLLCRRELLGRGSS